MGMSRTARSRSRKQRRVALHLGRRCALGARLALLAILAQAIIPVVHHVYHGYPLPLAVIAMAAEATHAGGDHDPAKKHAPTSDNRTPVCPVCQSTQHLTGALPTAADAMLAPSRQSKIVGTPRDTAAAVERPDSPAQPRAQPLTG